MSDADKPRVRDGILGAKVVAFSVAGADGEKKPRRRRGGEPPAGGGGDGGEAKPPRQEGPVEGDPWEDAPFVPLGKNGKKLWFIDHAGEVIDLQARAVSQYPDLALLCGGVKWLRKYVAFAARDKEGNFTGDFSQRKVCLAIIEQSSGLPPFDPAEPRRRYGLWRVEGGTALHLGRRLVWCGEDGPAGVRREGALWPTLAPRQGPGEPASAKLGQELERLLGAWNWSHPAAASVLLGLVANGMLGQVADWRAHGMLIGMEGSGKTTLLRDVVGPLCGLSVYKNSFTEAGLRQMLSETAAPLILDEAESGPRGDLDLQKVLEMLRRASSGAGLEAVKGGQDHEARSFNVTASAILGAILPPAMTPQDASRFTTLTLNELPKGSDDVPAIAWVAQHGAAVWGRVIAHAGRIRELFRAMRRQLIDQGATRREADQLGSIAAARWAVVRDPEDDPADAAEIDQALACVAWLRVPDEERALDSGGNQALQRLLATPADMAGDKMTLGQLLDRVRELPALIRQMRAEPAPSGSEEERLRRHERDLDTARMLLEGHGVRWGPWPAQGPLPQPGLYVTTAANPRLVRAFAETPWAGQRWAAALQQLKGAVGSRVVGSVRMAGGKPRCVWVPDETLAKLL